MVVTCPNGQICAFHSLFCPLFNHRQPNTALASVPRARFLIRRRHRHRPPSTTTTTTTATQRHSKQCNSNPSPSPISWTVTTPTLRPTLFIIDTATLIQHAHQAFPIPSSPSSSSSTSASSPLTSDKLSPRALHAFTVTLTTLLKRHICGRPVLSIFPSCIPQTSILSSICTALGLSVIHDDNNPLQLISSVIRTARRSGVRTIIISADIVTPVLSLVDIPWISILIVRRAGLFQLVTPDSLSNFFNVNFLEPCHIVDALALSTVILPLSLAFKLIVNFGSLNDLLGHVVGKVVDAGSSDKCRLTSNVKKRIVKGYDSVLKMKIEYDGLCQGCVDILSVNWQSVQRRPVDVDAITFLCNSSIKVSGDGLRDRMLHSADDVPLPNTISQSILDSISSSPSSSSSSPSAFSSSFSSSTPVSSGTMSYNPNQRYRTIMIDEKLCSSNNDIGSDEFNIYSSPLNYVMNPSVNEIETFVQAVKNTVSIIPVFNSSDNKFQKQNQFSLIAMAFCNNPSQTILIPFSRSCKIPKCVTRILCDGKIEKHGWFLKHIIKSLHSDHNIPLRNLHIGFKSCFDIHIASHLIHTGQDSTSITKTNNINTNNNNNNNNNNISDSYIASRYLNSSSTYKQTIDSILSKNHASTLSISNFMSLSNEMCLKMCDMAYSLSKIMRTEIVNQGLEKVMFGVEAPLVCVIADMELIGVPIDMQQLQFLHDELRKQRISLRVRLNSILSTAITESLNLSSTRDVSSFLSFSSSPIQINRKSLSQIASSSNVSSAQREFAKLYLEYRQITHLLRTSTTQLLSTISNDNKIHTTFKQNASSSGRISTSSPNLQCIPSTLTLNGLLRSIICVHDKSNMCILIADYSQVELRIMASLSKDKELIFAFKNNVDIHSYIACSLFQKKVVGDKERNIAKQIIYSIIYGISAKSLNFILNNNSIRDTEILIQLFNRRFNGLYEYTQKLIKDAYNNGYVTSLYGRRQWLPQLYNNDKKNEKKGKGKGKRMAVNMPIQGTQSDMIKIAMRKVCDRLSTLPSNEDNRLIMQMHDELILQIDKNIKDDVVKMVIEEMTNALPLSEDIQIAIKVGVGTTWLDAINSSQLYSSNDFT